MQNLHELEDTVLIDLLAEYTERYTRLFVISGNPNTIQNINIAKTQFQYIILELDRRKKPIGSKDASIHKDPGQFTDQ
jgi:hypothetical protein